MRQAAFQKLLRKYHNGTATDAERFIVDRWYDSFGNGRKKIPALGTEKEKAVVRLRIWQRVGYRMQIPMPWYGHRAYRIAAVAGLAVLIAVSVWIFQGHTGSDKQIQQRGSLAGYRNEVETGSGQVKKVLLPDSTLVWLNANSRITVLPGYGKDTRRLSLLGQAFFDVRPHSSCPFSVWANGIAITVIGTSFEVQSYESLQKVKVSVSTGKVLVANAKSKHLSELSAGESLAYNRVDASLVTDKIAPDDLHLWKEGKEVLVRASFDELAQSFHNLYGIRLSTTDTGARTYRYNVTLLSSQRQDEAIGLICTILKKHYKKETNGTITIY